MKTSKQLHFTSSPDPVHPNDKFGAYPAGAGLGFGVESKLYPGPKGVQQSEPEVDSNLTFGLEFNPNLKPQVLGPA